MGEDDVEVVRDQFFWTFSGFCPAGAGKILRTDFAVSKVDDLITGLAPAFGLAVVPQSPVSTTSTTLPTTGCSRAATLDSLRCRVNDVGQTIAGASGLGGLQSDLVARIGKAGGKLDQTAASCAQSKLRPARKALTKASGLVASSVAKIRSPRGRKIIDPGLTAELLGALTPIREDIGTLRGALACP